MESIVLDRDLKKNTVLQNHLNQVSWNAYHIKMNQIPIFLHVYIFLMNTYFLTNIIKDQQPSDPHCHLQNLYYAQMDTSFIPSINAFV